MLPEKRIFDKQEYFFSNLKKIITSKNSRVASGKEEKKKKQK